MIFHDTRTEIQNPTYLARLISTSATESIPNILLGYK